MTQRKAKSERGSVLLVFLIMTTVFVFLLGFGTNMITGGYRRIASVAQRNQAYYLAEAGVERALKQLTEEGCQVIPTTSPVSFPVRSPIGSYWYSVTFDGSQANIISTGKAGRQEISIQVTVSCSSSPTPSPTPSPIPPLDMAVFASTSISLSGSAIISGNAGVNSTAPGSITLSGNPRIYGIAYVGPGGNQNAISYPSWESLGYFISGGHSTLDSIRQYTLPPFPEYPSNLPARGSFVAGWWPAPPYYITEDGQYDTLEVQSTLVINVGTGKRILRVKNLKVTGSGKIILEGTGTLVLYVEQTVTLDNGGGVNVDNNNNPRNPSQLFMYYSGTALSFPNDVRFAGNIYAASANVNISNSGKVIGNLLTGGTQVTIDGDSSAYVRAIYAPNAAVTLQGSGKVKGTIIAKSFSASGGASVTYHTPPQEFIDALGELFRSGSDGSGSTGSSSGPSSTALPVPLAITGWEEAVSPSPSP